MDTPLVMLAPVLLLFVCGILKAFLKIDGPLLRTESHILPTLPQGDFN